MTTRKLFFLVPLLLFSCREVPGPISVEFRIAEVAPSEGLTQMIFSGWGNQDTFYVHPDVELTEREIISADVTTLNGQPAVAVEFSETGTEILSRLTGNNVGKHMAIIVDGTLISAPRIQAQILVGRAILNGEYTDEQARGVASKLDR